MNGFIACSQSTHAHTQSMPYTCHSLAEDGNESLRLLAVYAIVCLQLIVNDGTIEGEGKEIKRSRRGITALSVGRL